MLWRRRSYLLLSLALAWAEVLDARDLVVGVNAVDYSGYPDCRPAFIEAFQRLAAVATKAGVEGAQFRIHAPLIAMSKAQIVRGERTRLAESKGAARKLIEGGGVYLYNERQSGAQTSVTPDHLRWPDSLMLRTGKKNYHLILVD